MELAEAYQVLNLAPGATEAQVYAAQQHLVEQWLPYRKHSNPSARQRADVELARFELAPQIIAAAGFPSVPQLPPALAAASKPPAPKPVAPRPAPAPAAPRTPVVRVAPGPSISEQRSRASLNIAFGIVLILIGVGITVATRQSASGGGTYIIAYGPVVVGVIRLFRGLAGLAG
jgi:hypothetical protein